MAKTRILEYEIFLTTAAQVNTLNTQFPNGIRLAPADAATTYAAPIQEYTAAFSAPCVRSAWFWFTPPTNYPRNVATFSRCSGGWFGICFLFGTTTNYIWAGKFKLAPDLIADIGGTPTEVVALAQRRWVDGFELPIDGEGPSGGVFMRSVSKDSSRHNEGYGLSFRGDTGRRLHTVTALVPAHTARNHWDRFYIRIRKAPIAAADIWLSNGGTGNDGIRIQVLPGLNLAVSDVRSGADTLLASTTTLLVVNVWARIDIVMSYATGAGGAGAFCKVHINGVLVASLTTGSALGFGSQGAYDSTSLGSLPTTTLECDFDDWIGAEEPTKEALSPFRYVGMDWLHGSKCVRLRATSFGNGHSAVDWTNQSYSNLNVQGETAANAMASTTALATMDINVDAPMRADRQMNSLGMVALIVAVYHNVAGAGNTGSLGFRLAAGAYDMLALASQTGVAWQHYLHRRAVTTPAAQTPLAPMELRYVKANNANNDQVFQLNAVAELIGYFGAEDVPASATPPATMPVRQLGPHNSPYPESPWALAIKGPAAPYIIHSGTYVGNGLGQDLVFRLPVHWMYTRRTGINTHVVGTWFSTMQEAHQGMGDSPAGDNPVQAFIDPSFVGSGVQDEQEQRTIVRITGPDPQVNESGITYQYVIVSDPLARFMLAGNFGHGAVDETDNNALANTNFTPEGGFIQFEQLVGGTTTVKQYYKGLGHAANAASVLNATETADFLAWSAGNIQSRDASTLGVSLVAAYALWRRNDGSTDPGKPKVVQMGSYTGDGTASRTVTFGPTGVRPLWLIVVPHNAAAILRDPSHTGTTSCPVSGVNNATTGITGGGIDQFSVGSALNTNAIGFDWFLLPGSATAGNNGWSVDGEFVPVEPDTPFDGPADITEPNDPTTPLVPDPTTPTEPPSDTDDCAAGTVCVDTTTSEVNTALLELGVLQFLTNYCTQQTKEAIIARLLYDVSVRAVLHAFPWPFATKYATLALSATAPGNQDWLYSYLLPNDCIFARRLVVSRGTLPGDNPTPPPFMLSSNTAGGLVYTNEAAAVLEYTFRPACVAFTGDDLFREALKFHLAASMAPALTRMVGEAERCYGKYEACVEKANAIKKPGVPGLRPAAATIDVAATCVAANVDVVNRGLMRIGATTVANLSTEQSRESIAVNLVFE